MKGDIGYLIGKEVEVLARGVVYRGKLIEIGMEQIYLRSQTGWITVETLDVETIREPSSEKKRPK